MEVQYDMLKQKRGIVGGRTSIEMMLRWSSGWIKSARVINTLAWPYVTYPSWTFSSSASGSGPTLTGVGSPSSGGPGVSVRVEEEASSRRSSLVAIRETRMRRFQ